MEEAKNKLIYHTSTSSSFLEHLYSISTLKEQKLCKIQQRVSKVYFFYTFNMSAYSSIYSFRLCMKMKDKNSLGIRNRSSTYVKAAWQIYESPFSSLASMYH
jgi:hypothetical protein